MSDQSVCSFLHLFVWFNWGTPENKTWFLGIWYFSNSFENQKKIWTYVVLKKGFTALGNDNYQWKGEFWNKNQFYGEKLIPFPFIFRNRIGPTFLFYSGSFLQGICAIAFGFLAFTENQEIFLSMSYVLRWVKMFDKQPHHFISEVLRAKTQ